MPGAGAVGGVTPVQPAGTQDKLAGTRDNAGRTTAGAGEAKPAAPSATAALEAASRPVASLPADPAIALAATLAGLKVGQELRGQAKPLPGRPQALLTTPEGDFLIEPAPALQGETDLTVVLTRADRSISGLLLAAEGEMLDPPQTVRLTLVAVPPRPAPEEAQGQQPVPAAPAKALSAQPQPMPVPALTADGAALNSLLPGEALPLRGSGTLTGASPNSAQPLPPKPAVPTAQTLLSPAPGPALAPSVPRALNLGIPPAPAVGGQPAAALATLLEEGVLPLRLETPVKGQTHLSASLIAIAEADEITPLTRPAEGSPLARLAASGRLITATVLPLTGGEAGAMTAEPASPAPAASAATAPPGNPPPVQKTEAAPAPASSKTASLSPTAPASTPSPAPTAPADMGAPAPSARPQGANLPLTPGGTTTRPAPAAASPATSEQGRAPQASAPRLDLPQAQPLRLSANGMVMQLDLPASAPRPAAGTQFVFLVTRGREALPPSPAATMEARPQTRPAPAIGENPSAAAPPKTPQPHAPDNAPVAPARASAMTTAQPPAAPPAHSASAVPHTAAIPHQASPLAPATQASTGKADPPAAAHEAAAQSPAPPRAVETRRAPIAAASGDLAPIEGARGKAPAAPLALTPAGMMWMPGMNAPQILTSTQPLPTHPGEVLLLAVMQALGRKGFGVSAHPSSDHAGEAEPAEAADALQAVARLASAPVAEARPTAARDALAGDRLPDALPVSVTLQTPHGAMPLTLLVWQPLRPEEDGGHDGTPEGAGREVCFAVEVDFEKLGLLRLRGAVTPRHLQLGVETERPLDMALQRSATQDFNTAVEAGGMTGTLVFRHRQGR